MLNDYKMLNKNLQVKSVYFYIFQSNYMYRDSKKKEIQKNINESCSIVEL